MQLYDNKYSIFIQNWGSESLFNYFYNLAS